MFKKGFFVATLALSLYTMGAAPASAGLIIGAESASVALPDGRHSLGLMAGAESASVALPDGRLQGYDWEDE